MFFLKTSDPILQQRNAGIYEKYQKECFIGEWKWIVECKDNSNNAVHMGTICGIKLNVIKRTKGEAKNVA